MEGEVIKIYKSKGETPLERLDRLRTEHPKYKGVKLSYAGRLDPMAEGVMLILVGDKNQEREKYLKYSKEYTFEILFGFKTDSYDLLGIPKDKYQDCYLSRRILEKALNKFHGESVQSYPPYSSKTVKGKPLFQWTREGKLDKIEIPKHKVTVFESKILDIGEISKPDLKKEIVESIMRVKGDFRQKEILDGWDTLLKKTKEDKYKLVKVNIYCSSGTYVRSLANNIGGEVVCGALAYSIKRDDVRE